MNSRCLVVDDEHSIRISFKSILEDVGFTVFAMSTFEEAMKAINTLSFDLAFIDIYLLDDYGILLAKKLKKVNPDTLIIMMTGYPSKTVLQETLDIHAYEYLQKPISSELLIQVAKRAKERKEMIDEKKRIATEQRYNSFEHVVKQYIDSRAVDTVLEDQMQLLRTDMSSRLSRIQKTLRSAISHIREPGG